MFSRLGVFTGCEGECGEALIVDESDGVLQERCLAGWKERDVRMSLLAIIRPQAVSNIEAPLPAIIVGYVGLLWGSFGVLLRSLVPLVLFPPQRASTALRTTLSPLSGL